LLRRRRKRRFHRPRSIVGAEQGQDAALGIARLDLDPGERVEHSADRGPPVPALRDGDPSWFLLSLDEHA
jgi:hypothetical protein